MENQSHLSTASDKIDNKLAKQVLKRLCKAITKKYRIDVHPEFFDNSTSLVTSDSEIVAISNCKYDFAIFFENAISLLEALTSKDATISFSPFNTHNKITIDMNNIFGKTIDEMTIHFDLLNV